jgi:hypothetical protein
MKKSVIDLMKLHLSEMEQRLHKQGLEMERRIDDLSHSVKEEVEAMKADINSNGSRIEERFTDPKKILRNS